MDNKERWSKIYGKPISQEEVKNINHNLTGFFSTLRDWDIDKMENDEDGDLLPNKRPQ